MKVRELVTVFRLKVNEASFRNAEQNIASIKRSLSNLKSFLYGFGAPVAGWFTLKGVVNTLDDIAMMRARLGLLQQSTEGAGKAFDEVAKHASAAGISLESYGTLYYRIGNSSEKFVTTQKDLLKVTDAVAKSLTIGGVQGREAAAVMIQFSQALQSGVLQGDEYRTMRENAAWYLKQIAQELGVPMGKMRQLSSEGKLTSEKIIKATLAISDKINKEFEKFPMTFGRALAIASNQLKVFVDYTDRESNFIDSWSRKFLNMFSHFMDFLWGIREYFKGLNNVLRILGVHFSVILGYIAVKAVSKLTVATALLMGKWLLIAAAIGLVAAVIDDIIVTLRGGDSVFNMFGKWLSSFGDSSKKTNFVSSIFDSIADGMNAAIDAVLDVVSEIIDIFIDVGYRIAQAIMDGIVNGVIDGIQKALEYLSNIGSFAMGNEGFEIPTGGNSVSQENHIEINVNGVGNPEEVKEAAYTGVETAMDESSEFGRSLRAST